MCDLRKVFMAGLAVLLMLLLINISDPAFAQGGTWTTVAPMPTAQNRFSAGVINRTIYAVGGEQGSSGPVATVFAYDPATNIWTTVTPMSTPRLLLAVGVANGILYAIGGHNSTGFLDTLEAYDPATNTWTTKAAMPTPRWALGVGVVNGIIYAVGGGNGNGQLATVEAYDPATDTWTTKAAMPTPRNVLAVAVVNDILYAMGGYFSGIGHIVTTVEAYNPATDTWTTIVAPMPEARQELGAGVVNGIIYAIGVGDDGNMLTTVFAYDPVTNTWTTESPMPTPRCQLAVATANGVLYAMGGRVSTDFNIVATVEAFTPEVIDEKPPTLDPVADKSSLWPPNNKMVDITIRANASDNSGGPVTLAAQVSGVRASGKTCLEEITKRDIEAFIEHEQDRHLMLSTVRTKLHCVNAFLGYAIDTGVVRAEVLARRIRLKKPETLPRAMDPDDVRQFISAIDNPRDRAMIMVLLRTGMRIGELLNTKMNDLHLRDRKIDIYEGEKNRQGRVVYLSDDAMDALKAWLKIRDVHPGFLFFAQGRKSMAYSTARLVFEQYIAKAGLSHKGHSLHALRHTFASELLNAGMRIECLQPLMGHTSLDVTRRYARLTDKTREEEYFRAMTIIERGEIDGHYRCDHQVQAFLEEKERLTQHG